jgi:hypothetical protein
MTPEDEIERLLNEAAHTWTLEGNFRRTPMSQLSRLHDRLVNAEGHDCTCHTWGAPTCPAMQAAIAQRQRETRVGQLELADKPPAGQMGPTDPWPEGF